MCMVWESVNNGMDYWTRLLSAIADYRGIELASYILTHNQLWLVLAYTQVPFLQVLRVKGSCIFNKSIPVGSPRLHEAWVYGGIKTKLTRGLH